MKKSKRSLFRLGYSFFKKMSADQLDVYCAQSCFFLIMSLVPMMMIVLMVIKITPNLSEEEILNALASILNQDIMEQVQRWVSALYHGSLAGMFMTIVSLFYMSGRGVMGISKGLNRIYRVKENRNYAYLRLRATGYTLVMLATFLLSLLMIMYSVRAGQLVTSRVPAIHIHSRTMRLIAAIIALITLTVTFLMLYSFIPNGRRTFRSQMVGAVFSTISWGVFSFFFLIYLNLAHNVSLIYSGPLTLVMAMLWLYWCIYLFLVGAEINAYLENPDSFPF